MHNFISETIFTLLTFKQTTTYRSDKTVNEVSVLDTIFNMTNYPDLSTKQYLSLILNMPIRTVQVWFQNKRRYVRSTMHVLGNKNRRSPYPYKMLVRSVSGNKVEAYVILQVYCNVYGIELNLFH